MDSLQVGCVVDVMRRMWPGINKPGGVGRVTKIYHKDDGEILVDVTYIIGGGKETGIEEKYVKLHEVEEGRRRVQGRCRFCGSFIQDCQHDQTTVPPDYEVDENDENRIVKKIRLDPKKLSPDSSGVKPPRRSFHRLQYEDSQQQDNNADFNISSSGNIVEIKTVPANITSPAFNPLSSTHNHFKVPMTTLHSPDGPVYFKPLISNEAMKLSMLKDPDVMDLDSNSLSFQALPPIPAHTRYTATNDTIIPQQDYNDSNSIIHSMSSMGSSLLEQLLSIAENIQSNTHHPAAYQIARTLHKHIFEHCVKDSSLSSSFITAEEREDEVFINAQYNHYLQQMDSLSLSELWELFQLAHNLVVNLNTKALQFKELRILLTRKCENLYMKMKDTMEEEQMLAEREALAVEIVGLDDRQESLFKQIERAGFELITRIHKKILKGLKDTPLSLPVHKQAKRVVRSRVEQSALQVETIGLQFSDVLYQGRQEIVNLTQLFEKCYGSAVEDVVDGRGEGESEGEGKDGEGDDAGEEGERADEESSLAHGNNSDNNARGQRRERSIYARYGSRREEEEEREVVVVEERVGERLQKRDGVEGRGAKEQKRERAYKNEMEAEEKRLSLSSLFTALLKRRRERGQGRERRGSERKGRERRSKSEGEREEIEGEIVRYCQEREWRRERGREEAKERERGERGEGREGEEKEREKEGGRKDLVNSLTNLHISPLLSSLYKESRWREGVRKRRGEQTGTRSEEEGEDGAGYRREGPSLLSFLLEESGRETKEESKEERGIGSEEAYRLYSLLWEKALLEQGVSSPLLLEDGEQRRVEKNFFLSLFSYLRGEIGGWFGIEMGSGERRGERWEKGGGGERERVGERIGRSIGGILHRGELLYFLKVKRQHCWRESRGQSKGEREEERDGEGEEARREREEGECLEHIEQGIEVERRVEEALRSHALLYFSRRGGERREESLLSLYLKSRGGDSPSLSSFLGGYIKGREGGYREIGERLCSFRGRERGEERRREWGRVVGGVWRRVGERVREIVEQSVRRREALYEMSVEAIEEREGGKDSSLSSTLYSALSSSLSSLLLLSELKEESGERRVFPPSPYDTFLSLLLSALHPSPSPPSLSPFNDFPNSIAQFTNSLLYLPLPLGGARGGVEGEDLLLLVTLVVRIFQRIEREREEKQGGEEGKGEGRGERRGRVVGWGLVRLLAGQFSLHVSSTLSSLSSSSAPSAPSSAPSLSPIARRGKLERAYRYGETLLRALSSFSSLWPQSTESYTLFLIIANAQAALHPHLQGEEREEPPLSIVEEKRRLLSFSSSLSSSLSALFREGRGEGGEREEGVEQKSLLHSHLLLLVSLLFERGGLHNPYAKYLPLLSKHSLLPHSTPLFSALLPRSETGRKVVGEGLESIRETFQRILQLILSDPSSPSLAPSPTMLRKLKLCLSSESKALWQMVKERQNTCENTLLLLLCLKELSLYFDARVLHQDLRYAEQALQHISAQTLYRGPDTPYAEEEGNLVRSCLMFFTSCLIFTPFPVRHGSHGVEEYASLQAFTRLQSLLLSMQHLHPSSESLQSSIESLVVYGLHCSLSIAHYLCHFVARHVDDYYQYAGRGERGIEENLSLYKGFVVNYAYILVEFMLQYANNHTNREYNAIMVHHVFALHSVLSLQAEAHTSAAYILNIPANLKDLWLFQVYSSLSASGVLLKMRLLLTSLIKQCNECSATFSLSTVIDSNTSKSLLLLSNHPLCLLAHIYAQQTLLHFHMSHTGSPLAEGAQQMMAVLNSTYHSKEDNYCVVYLKFLYYSAVLDYFQLNKSHLSHAHVIGGLKKWFTAEVCEDMLQVALGVISAYHARPHLFTMEKSNKLEVFVVNMRDLCLSISHGSYTLLGKAVMKSFQDLFFQSASLKTTIEEKQDLIYIVLSQTYQNLINQVYVAEVMPHHLVKTFESACDTLSKLLFRSLRHIQHCLFQQQADQPRQILLTKAYDKLLNSYTLLCSQTVNTRELSSNSYYLPLCSISNISLFAQEFFSSYAQSLCQHLVESVLSYDVLLNKVKQYLLLCTQVYNHVIPFIPFATRCTEWEVLLIPLLADASYNNSKLVKHMRVYWSTLLSLPRCMYYERNTMQFVESELAKEQQTEEIQTLREAIMELGNYYIHNSGIESVKFQQVQVFSDLKSYLLKEGSPVCLRLVSKYQALMSIEKGNREGRVMQELVKDMIRIAGQVVAIVVKQKEE